MTGSRLALLAIVFTCCLGCQHAAHTPANDSFANLTTLSDAQSARVSSWDKNGGNTDFHTMDPGDSVELARLEGAGVIRHLYFTVMGPSSERPDYLRDLVLRAYWDGEEAPSVEAPLGDFFGQGHGKHAYFQSQLVTVNPGARLENGTSLSVGFNAYFPMPYGDGARLTLSNEGPLPIGAVWYHIDYEQLDRAPDTGARFHAQYRQERPTEAEGPEAFRNTVSFEGTNPDGRGNYTILDAAGQGNVAGYFLHVDNVAHSWYGEGDDMIFIDGETWPPSFHGTGTEEIFGGGACPSVPYFGPYTGFHLIDNEDYFGAVSMYRFYVADPIHFRKSIRMTIEHGHNNNYANEYSSTAFWYQREPHAPFPPLPPALERNPKALAFADRTAPEGGEILLPTHASTARTAGWVHFQSRGAYAFDGYWAPAGDGSEQFTWTFAHIAPGNYELFLWLSDNPNRDHASDAQYRLDHAQGSIDVQLDQTANLERWHSLGAYDLDAQSTLRLTNQANGNVVADAIALMRR